MSDSVVPGLRFTSRAQELWAAVIASLGGWQQRVHEVAAATGLSPVSAWALVQLDPEHPVAQKELAARLHCRPSTVVDPTDRLEHAGLVVRQPNPADRRVKVLTVTQKGRRVRAQMIEQLFAPPESFRRLGAQEQARFRDAMVAAATGARPPSSSKRATRRMRP